MVLLGSNWGIDYSGRGPQGQNMDYLKAMALWETLCAEGWKEIEFQDHLREFKRTNTFSTWTEADFFKHARPRVHDYAWYLAEIHEKPHVKGQIQAYFYPGHPKPVWGYVKEVRGRLQLWVEYMKQVNERARQTETVNAIGAAQTSPDAPKDQTIPDYLQVLKRAIEAEETIQMLRKELARAHAQIERLEDVNYDQREMNNRQRDIIETLDPKTSATRENE